MTEKIDPKDILISRLVEGEASGEDWMKFKEHAARDEGVWAELALAQRQQEELGGAVEALLTVADRVEAPVNEQIAYSFQKRWRTAATWGGWLAAAAFGLAWTIGMPSREAVDGSAAGFRLPAFGSPTEALQSYYMANNLDGQVMEEVPTKVLLDVQPNPDGGGNTVVFLHQFVTRCNVPNLYSPTEDEAGNTALLRVEIVPALKDPL